MLPTPLRAVCASAAVALFLGGMAGLVFVRNPLFILSLLGAVALAMASMFGGRRPTSIDLPRIEEQLHRFRHAMLLCFIAATGVYGFVITARHSADHNVLQRAASLGIAFWLVAFVLMFFVAYYRSQRRLALNAE